MREITAQDLDQFWREQGDHYLMPPVDQHGRPAAGWNEVAFIRTLNGQLLRNNTVFDLGCGSGRFALAFDKAGYIGGDIIGRGQEKQPLLDGYRFIEVPYHGPYPEAELVLAYCLLLHVPDSSLVVVAENMKRAALRHILVVEILGRAWRHYGEPPAFNRERVEYVEAFAPEFQLAFEIRKPYLYYQRTDISMLLFQRIK